MSNRQGYSGHVPRLVKVTATSWQFTCRVCGKVHPCINDAVECSTSHSFEPQFQVGQVFGDKKLVEIIAVLPDRSKRTGDIRYRVRFQMQLGQISSLHMVETMTESAIAKLKVFPPEVREHNLQLDPKFAPGDKVRCTQRYLVTHLPAQDGFVYQIMDFRAPDGSPAYLIYARGSKKGRIGIFAETGL